MFANIIFLTFSCPNALPLLCSILGVSISKAYGEGRKLGFDLNNGKDHKLLDFQYPAVAKPVHSSGSSLPC